MVNVLVYIFLQAKCSKTACFTSFSINSAVNILRNFNVNKKEHVETIYNPKGGNVFIYYNPGKPKDFKIDGYLWRNKGGHKNTPIENPEISKSYYNVMFGEKKVSEEFSKITYALIDQITRQRKESPILIQYLGCEDEDRLKYFKSDPHGNVKDKASLVDLNLHCLLLLPALNKLYRQKRLI